MILGQELIWIFFEAETKTRILVQVSYLGISGNINKNWGSEIEKEKQLIEVILSVLP